MTSANSSDFTNTDFKALFEAVPTPLLVLSPGFVIVAVNNAYLRASKTQRDAIVGQHLFTVFPDNPDDAAADGVNNLRHSLETVLATRAADAMAVQKYDIRLPDSEGGGFIERYWSPINSPVFGDDGRIAYLIHRVEDVTDFVRLQKRGAAPQADLNSRLATMESEILRRARELQETNNRLREAEEESRKANELLELRVVERTIELQNANEALRSEMGSRQQIETQFRQAQKMEAVGQLAGGIAHDFNNLLTVILNFGMLARIRVGSTSPAYADILEIEKAGERAAVLTKQLLAFSRHQVLDEQVLNLNDVITGSEPMLRRLIGEDIDFVTSLHADLGSVKADRSHLEQILMNLLVNSRDAMPSGGKLTVETSNVELDDKYTQGHIGAKPGPYVMLAVSDTGTGMDAKTQASIFLPFFTTKEVGSGTGLGLAMVHGVVRQSGGEILVYSTPGRGTTFKIYLPRVLVGLSEEPKKRTITPQPLPRASGTILLVEDEEGVRKVAERVLSDVGYRVITAPNPIEALRLFTSKDFYCDLVLSDVVMPGMDGPTLAHRLLQMRPDLKVLFMSGYTGGALVHRGVLQSDFAYLQKPFTPGMLVTKVREVIGMGTRERQTA